ncbi:hypothetical protein WJX77_007327 [Trebouxia sp. C0004]
MHQRLLRAQAPGQQAFAGHGRSQRLCRTHRPLQTVTRQISCQQQSHDDAHGAAIFTAKTVRKHAVNLSLSLILAAVCSLQQPLPAAADASTTPPPIASSSSAASSAASRTVVDVVSGENSVLNEENTPDNRDSPGNKSEESKNPVADTSEAPYTTADSQQVYLDLSVDGEPRGRLVIKLTGDAPVGTRRFAQLSQGLNGVGYRLSKFDGIAQGFIKNSGQRSLTYDASNMSRVAGGDTVEELEAEMAESTHRHDAAGTVSLIVKDTRTKVGKTKLVAYNGKLIRVEEPTPGESPNGSGFVITTQPAPDLDATNLVIGHLVDGMDVVQQLTKLPTVKANNSVFFKAGKFLGDKRADVAEKGFGRPFQKVLVSASGLYNSAAACPIEVLPVQLVQLCRYLRCTATQLTSIQRSITIILQIRLRSRDGAALNNSVGNGADGLPGAGIVAGPGTAQGFDTGFGSFGAGNTADTSTGSYGNSGAGDNVRSGINTGYSTGSGSTTGVNTGHGHHHGHNTGAGYGTGTGTGITPSADPGNPGCGSGTCTGSNPGTGTGLGSNPGYNSGASAGTGTGSNPGYTGTGSNPGYNSGARTGTGTYTGSDSSISHHADGLPRAGVVPGTGTAQGFHTGSGSFGAGNSAGTNTGYGNAGAGDNVKSGSNTGVRSGHGHHHGHCRGHGSGYGSPGVGGVNSGYTQTPDFGTGTGPGPGTGINKPFCTCAVADAALLVAVKGLVLALRHRWQHWQRQQGHQGC